MTRIEIIEALTLLKEQARNSGVNSYIWNVSRESFNFVIDSAIKAIEQEPKIGNWIRVIHTTERGILIPYCKCSECGKAIDITFCFSPFTYNYCPNCGTKMTESGNK